MSSGVGHKRSLDPALLWLWCRPVAAAPIHPLAWKPPNAKGAAKEREERPKKKKKKGRNTLKTLPHSRPGLWGEVISATVDYFYWQLMTLEVDHILGKSPGYISPKALRKLSLALPMLLFRTVKEVKKFFLWVIKINFTCLVVFLLCVSHHLIMEKYKKGQCH